MGDVLGGLGGRLRDVWETFGGRSGGVWLMFGGYFVVVGCMCGVCLGNVWIFSGGDFEDIRRVWGAFGKCLGDALGNVLELFGRCLGDVSGMFWGARWMLGGCSGDVW